MQIRTIRVLRRILFIVKGINGGLAFRQSILTVIPAMSRYINLLRKLSGTTRVKLTACIFILIETSTQGHSDEKDRYLHIYYSYSKAASEREDLESKIDRIAAYLKKQEGQPVIIDKSYEKYFS